MWRSRVGGFAWPARSWSSVASAGPTAGAVVCRLVGYGRFEGVETAAVIAQTKAAQQIIAPTPNLRCTTAACPSCAISRRRVAQAWVTVFGNADRIGWSARLAAAGLWRLAPRVMVVGYGCVSSTPRTGLALHVGAISAQGHFRKNFQRLRHWTGCSKATAP